MGLFRRRSADQARQQSTDTEAAVPAAEAEPPAPVVPSHAPGTTPAHATDYAAACATVADLANACLEEANRSVGARNMAAQRPQHEISIANFTSFAEQAESDLKKAYPAFDDACSDARKAAATLLAGEDDALMAETALLTSGIEEGTLDKVPQAKAILRSRFGPTPEEFLQGIEETNRWLENDDPVDGNIYTPRAPTEGAEKSCPWCAETIKAEAVICRYCGQDARSQPNAL